MLTIADPAYLCFDQYKNAANLNIRIELHRRFSVNRYGWQRWVFDQFDLPPQARLLELGCGPADLWRENRHRLPAGWQLILSDLSPGMIEQAQAALTAAGLTPLPRCEVIDAQAIPYPDATFDAVIANHMLYHVPDRPKALAEMRRVLRTGGRLYAATVGAGHLAELRALIEAAVGRSLPPDPAAEAFSLENGPTQLAPWFAAVERRDYPDALVISEPEPLIAYILSARAWFGLDDEAEVAPIAQMVRQRLKAEGVIYLSKSSGLLVGEAR